MSFGAKAAQRALLALDGGLAGFSGNYGDVRPKVAAILKRQRFRAKWHEDYMGLEDACWTVAAADIRFRQKEEEDSDISQVLAETEAAASLLYDSLDFHLYKSQPSKGLSVLRRGIGQITDLLHDAGPYEEHSQYMQYGILDLAYQFSFRIRHRSRPFCFQQFVKLVRMVLERSSPNLTPLHLKALDLFNRVCHQDSTDSTDRRFVLEWKSQHGIDDFETSVE